MQVRYPNAHCCICQREFYRRPWEFKKWKEFCCRSCRTVLYKTQKEVWFKNLQLGRAWNKGMSKSKGDSLVYGKPRSDNTRRLISEKLKKAWMNNPGLIKHAFRNTDIERILESWLIENNIKYEKQKQLLGITLVDFFILPNICLYADGDYWHSLPDKKQRDKVINETLRRKNYEVIRLLGSEIKRGIRPLGLLQKG